MNWQCSECGSQSYTRRIVDNEDLYICGWCNNQSLTGVDISKRSTREIEEMANKGGASEAAIKKAGFQQYMDRLTTSIKNTNDETKHNDWSRHKKMILEKYNKYHGTNFKS